MGIGYRKGFLKKSYYMVTKVLKASEERDILTAIELLKAGEVVAVPTETVYGLAADAKNVAAVAKIFSAKNRPNNHPLIVHIHSAECLSQWAQDVPPAARKLAQAFWPGPLTILLKKHSNVSDAVTGGLDTVALRVPRHPVLLRIIKTLQTGLAAPSANLHKRISPTSAEHVLSSLGGRIAAVVDAGPCAVGLESTIVDVTGDTPKILRPGPISQAMLESVLQGVVHMPAQHQASVPGNMKIHYKPQAETILASIEEIQVALDELCTKNKRCAVMYYSDFSPFPQHVITRKMSTNKDCYARELYQALHELDATNPDKIFVQAPPQDDAWADIWDRLSKACA